MPRTRLLMVLSLIPVASLAQAHWVDQPGQPAWARRGYCQWGHGASVDGRVKWMAHGFGVDAPNAKLLLDCGRNLEQTIEYMSPEARAIGEGGGIKRQPYICSKTIWWRSEFPKAPQLEKCTIVGPDGKRVLLYNNPERYGGCYSSPIWLEYMKGRVDELMRSQSATGGTIHSIFFDNAADYNCYCADCRDKFKAWSREKYGQEMDLATPEKYSSFAFLKQWFDADMAVEFFKQVKAYITQKYGPDVLISPNISIGYGWSDYLVNHGATDLVFIEEGFTLPPTDSTVLKYKLGLAASHGKTTGQLLGLSEMLRRERALALDKNNEMGILESFVYPEEHKLALAEAAATGGADCVSFGLREQKILSSDAPYQVQMREAIHQYADFQKQHLAWWDSAQPGAKVAVVQGIMTQLADRSPTTLRATCEALGRAGVPYEVLVEEDLTPEQLAQYQLVILPRLRLLNRDHCESLLKYVQQGGSVLRVGDLATADELGRSYEAGQLLEIAKGAVGETRSLGRGKVLNCDPKRLEQMPPTALVKMLEDTAGPLECRVQTQAPRVFANILTSADGRTRTIHLVNSDVTYDAMPSKDIRDDSGTPGARSFLGATNTRIRKTLLVPDVAAAKGYQLRFFGSTCGIATDRFSLVVSFNGQPIKTYRGSELNEAGWFETPVPEGLIKPVNEVIFQATGAPNGHPDWFAIKIDTTAKTGRSWWSADDGKTWTHDDLSLDSGAQTGEFLVRLGPVADPNAVAKPEDFMGKLHVRPAKDVRVLVKTDRLQPARLCSPDGPEQTLKPVRDGEYAVYRVPEVYLYSVLVLGK